MRVWQSTLISGFGTLRLPSMQLDFITYAPLPTSENGPGFTGYLMLFWYPGRGSPFNRPSTSHSSLVRVRPVMHPEGRGPMITKQQFFEAYYQEAEPAIQAIWAAMTWALVTNHPQYRGQGQVSGQPSLHVHLSLPPWPFSWNFGVSNHLEAAINPVARFFEEWVQNRFAGRVRILEGRPVHISWE